MVRKIGRKIEKNDFLKSCANDLLRGLGGSLVGRENSADLDFGERKNVSDLENMRVGDGIATFELRKVRDSTVAGIV